MPQFESFYFETHGDTINPAVVFLHGFLGNGHSWSQIISSLTEDFFSITIDLPGHGQTLPKSDGEYGFAKCAKSIVGIADELRLKQFNLVGYSMGGRLALYLALKYPNKINKLVLESSSPGLKTESEREERQQADEKLAEELKRTPLGVFIEKWYNQPLFESIRKNHKEFEALKKERLSNDSAGLAKSLKYMGTGAQGPLWEKVPELSFSTHLIVGELDRKFQEIAGQMSAMSQKIKIECVKGAGHNVHFEKPIEYAALLNQILK